MWDALTPITVGGHHLGNVFTGQFFFDDERLDRELFQSQASRYGFDREAYLAALESVPRLGRERVAEGMAFLAKFAGMLSQLSFSNIKLARSVAEREALMSSLQENKARLEEEDRKKNEFLAVLSHELRNPLAPIRNSVHILHRAPPGSDQAIRAQNVIERQAGHLTRLVDDLLDVARIARGRIELRRTRTDLREVVLRAADDFRAMMDERGLTFHVEVPAMRAWADLDATRVTQVIGNLLHNAAKFASRGDEVSLSLGVANGQGVISVRDTGPGIDPALLPLIFDTFVQEERTLARSSGGLGLGLPLVKNITELHGGTVCAESAGVDKGAQFTIVMPLAPVAAPQETERPVVVRRLTPRRVLIVDDNRDSADSLADIVELLGHVVEVAYDGPSAIEKARASAPHVVLCDIGLPGMSGYEVARALRAGATNAMQLIAVTGYAHPDDVKEAVAAGFDGHVAKPASADAIERLLG
jgi:signal transduction histidine kinase